MYLYGKEETFIVTVSSYMEGDGVVYEKGNLVVGVKTSNFFVLESVK